MTLPPCSADEVCLAALSRDRYRGLELTATRMIEPGEVVLKERPLATAPPRQLRRQHCFVCGVRLGSKERLCAREDCAEVASGEAAAVESFPWLFDHEEPLLLLRLLLRLQKEPALAGEAFDLEDLPLILAEDDDINACARDVLASVPDLCSGLTHGDVARLLRAIRVNALGVCETDARVVTLLRMGSRLSHSCAPNCYWTYSGDRCIVVRASHRVSAGETLTVSYCDLSLPTPSRRRELLSSKYFLCLCDRCRDPFELGRHSSTLLCRRCGHAMGLTHVSAVEAEARPQGELSLAQQHGVLSFLEQGGCETWTCGACGSELDATADSYRAVTAALEAAGASQWYDVGALTAMDRTEAEGVVSELASEEVQQALLWLHPNHWLRHRHSLAACIVHTVNGDWAAACGHAIDYCETSDNLYTARSGLEDCAFRLAGWILKIWAEAASEDAKSAAAAAAEAGVAELQSAAATATRLAAQLYGRSAHMFAASRKRFEENRGADHPLTAASLDAEQRCAAASSSFTLPDGTAPDGWAPPPGCSAEDAMSSVPAQRLARAALGDLAKGCISQGSVTEPDAEMDRLRAALAEAVRERDAALESLRRSG